MAWVTGLRKKYLPFVNLSRLLCKTDKLFKMKFHSHFFAINVAIYSFSWVTLKSLGVKIPRLRLTRVWICSRKTTRWTSWATSSDSTWTGLRTSKTTHMNIWKSSLCVDNIFFHHCITSFLMACEVDFAVHTYSWALFRQLPILVERRKHLIQLYEKSLSTENSLGNLIEVHIWKCHR